MTTRIDAKRTKASHAKMKRPKKSEPTNLEDVLDEIAAKCDGDSTPDSLTLDEILDSVGRRSYGPLLLVIGLFAISPATIVPGMTWLAAALTLLVAGQMALGLPRAFGCRRRRCRRNCREMRCAPASRRGGAQRGPWTSC